jgi:excisionase family DNA binding protein
MTMIFDKNLIDRYNKEIELAKQKKSLVDCDHEDIVQNISLFLLQKNLFEKISHVGFIRKCILNGAKGSFSYYLKLKKRHLEYAYRNSKRDIVSVPSSCSSLNKKKMSLAVESIPCERNKVHIIHKFYKNTPRDLICKETGVGSLQDHDQNVRRGLRNIQNIWAAFDHFTEEQIWNMKKLDLLSVEEASKILKICPSTIVRNIKSNKIKAIMVGNGYRIERSWLN